VFALGLSSHNADHHKNFASGETSQKVKKTHLLSGVFFSHNLVQNDTFTGYFCTEGSSAAIDYFGLNHFLKPHIHLENMRDSQNTYHTTHLILAGIVSQQ